MKKKSFLLKTLEDSSFKFLSLKHSLVNLKSEEIYAFKIYVSASQKKKSMYLLSKEMEPK